MPDCLEPAIILGVNSKRTPQPWPAYVWGVIILGIGIFVMALMLFVSEEQTASALPDWLALAYMLGGKWGLAALFVLLAAVFFDWR